MMDGDQLREELRKRIAQEVHAQFSAYRGAVSAELTFMDQELDGGLRRVQDKFASVGAEILESHALRVTHAIARAQGLVGTWLRALLFGVCLFAGAAAAAWIAIAWTEQQFRWQVAKNAEIAEQIAAQEHTLEQLQRRAGGLTLVGPDSDGHCFVLFAADAAVTTVWRVQNRPAVEVQCND